MPYRYIDEAVIAFNLDEITWCNQQAVDLLGYPSPELLVGIEPLILVSDEHYFDLLMGVKTARTTKIAGSIIISLVHRNEYTIPCILRYAFNPEDECFYAIVRPLLKVDDEKKLTRFIELVKNDIKTPEKVIEKNRELIRRMSLNRHMLAEQLSNIKYTIDEMREKSNQIIDSISNSGFISSQR